MEKNRRKCPKCRKEFRPAPCFLDKAHCSSRCELLSWKSMTVAQFLAENRKSPS